MRMGRRYFCMPSVAEIARWNKRRLLQVDVRDRQVGELPLFEAHRSSALARMQLHRAFSLFVLDGNGNTLLQRRSAHKVTYPLHWSNAVCSHPLVELGEAETAGHLGVKRAARRRLDEELGVAHGELGDFAHVGRFIYQHRFSVELGESELDHVLVLQRALSAKELGCVDPGEVCAVEWVPLEGLLSFLAAAEARGEPYTPWMLPALSIVLAHFCLFA